MFIEIPYIFDAVDYNYNKFMDTNIALGNILYDYKIGIIKKLDTADREQ